MIGDRSYGIFNLRIQNASLEDDAEFQCQVGPAKNSDPIRTAANLTVICEYRFQLPRACALLSIITPRIIKLSKHDIVLAQGCVECQHNPLSISQVDVYSHAGHLKNNSFVTKANNTLCNLCVRCVLAAAASAVTWPASHSSSQNTHRTRGEKKKENTKPKHYICAVLGKVNKRLTLIRGDGKDGSIIITFNIIFPFHLNSMESCQRMMSVEILQTQLWKFYLLGLWTGFKRVTAISSLKLSLPANFC